MILENQTNTLEKDQAESIPLDTNSTKSQSPKESPATANSPQAPGMTQVNQDETCGEDQSTLPLDANSPPAMSTTADLLLLQVLQL